MIDVHREINSILQRFVNFRKAKVEPDELTLYMSKDFRDRLAEFVVKSHALREGDLNYFFGISVVVVDKMEGWLVLPKQTASETIAWWTE